MREKRPVSPGPILVLLSLLLVLLLASCRLISRRPHVMLICLDTVRYDTFWLPESAGLKDSFTPWAERAIRFQKTLSTSSWTIPAIASVMTGLFPEQHSAGRFPDPIANLALQVPTGLPEHFETLADIFSAAGYRAVNLTAHPWISPEFGLARGFQQSEVHDDEIFLEEFFRWLLANREALDREPFFLNLHLMTAHDWHRQPHAVLRHNAKKMDSRLAEAAHRLAPVPVEEMQDKGMRFFEYVRAVSFLRERMARLLTTLSQTWLLSNTVILVYSDHGEEFGEHLKQEQSEGRDPRGVYGDGHGHSLFQELLHVPMLAWVPGQAGTDVQFATTLADVAPTLLSWAGLAHGAPLGGGLDLSQAISASAAAEAPKRALYASGIAYGAAKRAVLLGPWKLIRDYEGNSHLYHLELDPREYHPQNEDSPEPLKDLLSLLETTDRPPAGEPALPPTLSPEQLQRLRALGYLSGQDQ